MCCLVRYCCLDRRHVGGVGIAEILRRCVGDLLAIRADCRSIDLVVTCMTVVVVVCLLERKDTGGTEIKEMTIYRTSYPWINYRPQIFGSFMRCHHSSQPMLPS